jgi:hypothetical protein
LRWAAAFSYVLSDVFVRSGHWASQVLIGSIVGAIALRVAPIQTSDPLALLVPLLLMLLVVVSWLRMRDHDRRLCERCMASMPLNPSLAAQRYRRRFATTHLGSNKPLMISYLLVLVGSAFLPGPAGTWIWATVQATMIYLILSSVTHRRLQPWCPKCQGEGGGESSSHTPDPMPQGGHR